VAIHFHATGSAWRRVTPSTRTSKTAPIAVPTVTLDGEADRNFPATDGTHRRHSSSVAALTGACRMPATTSRKKLLESSRKRSLS
jgi:hypothetical protein